MDPCLISLRRDVFGHLATIFLAVAALIVAGCPSSASKEPSDTILVGAFLSLTGADSAFGIDVKDGIELAVDETNKKGGIRGKKIRVLYEDDKSTSQEASNKVRQLIDRDRVIALLGDTASSRSIAGGIIANSKKIPLIAAGATADEVTQDRDYVFRSCFTDSQQGEVAARFVFETLEKKRAGIFYAAQDTYSSGLAQSFRERFEKLGGTIVVDKSYQKGETNFTTYLQELKAAGAEALFLPLYYNDMIQIGRQAKQVGLGSTSLVGGDGWDSSDLIQGAGAELNGAFFTNHYAPDVPWENSLAFFRAFKERTKREPNSVSAQGYDAAMLLFDAIGRAPDFRPESIKVALAETKHFVGATGSIMIDKNHNAKKPIVIVKIEDLKFRYSGQFLSE